MLFDWAAEYNALMKSARALRASLTCLRTQTAGRLAVDQAAHSNYTPGPVPGLPGRYRQITTHSPSDPEPIRALADPSPLKSRTSLSSADSSLPHLSTVLPDLPTSLPAHQWRDLLNHPHGVEDLLGLLPRLSYSLDDMSLSDGVDTLAAVLRHLGNLSMLAPTSAIVRLFENRLDRAFKDGNEEISMSIEGAYKQIIEALTTFSRQSIIPCNPTRNTLNQAANAQVLPLVKSLVNRLDSLPTTSSVTSPTLSHDMLSVLFDKPILHTALMQFLLNHTRQRGVNMTSRMWWRCFLLAVDEGDVKAARRFRTKAAQVAKREGKTATPPIVEEDPANPYPYRTSRPRIHDLINLRTHRRLDQALPDLQGQLHTSEPTSSHAWSYMLNVSRKDQSVTSSDLASLRHAIAQEAVTSHAYTSMMLGLLERSDVNGAWEVWRDLVERERQSPSRGAFVDCVALAAGTHVCHGLLGLDAAVKLVDAWAQRTPQSGNQDQARDPARTVVLDTTNVNVLLTLCRRQRKPSIALRIFKAALPRWGVYTDDISLTLLLDTCKHHDQSLKEGDTLRTRLRQLADELRQHQSSSSLSSSKKDYDAYDAAGFAKGPTSVLLDQPGSNWRTEHPEPPWSLGRLWFREMLLSNWPSLKQISSPLDFEKGPYAHLSRDISSFFRRSIPTSSNSDSDSDSNSIDIPTRANHVYLVPSANTFQSYITLLGYHNLSHEIPGVLAWMRYLRITPTRKTMLLALTYLGEVEGPRRVLADWEGGRSKLVRDTEVMRRWLSEWIDRGVPNEDQLAEFRRSTVQANRRLTA